MNNRPLTYLSEEVDELSVLKPSMFLQSLPGNEVADLDHIEAVTLVKRFNYLQSIREKLRVRFKREYLGLLKSSKARDADTVKVGDIVIIGNDNKRRLDWPLAKVVEVFPGRHGVNRLTKVKTANGYLLRPIQILYPLEIHCKTEESIEEREPLIQRSQDFEKRKFSEVELEKHPIQTRSGRVIRPKERLDL